ncbi:MAG: hydantoinase B/oxoprolinase family protein, partial [Cyclobacteriaceae bacterium]|nr:hydantoinase B/oxoprolinase family protein [Cyclobacteriaceae bacterium]
PLNEGLLKNVELIIPENTLLNPKFDTDADKCPAVVGGNTEISQRLTDTLFKALRVVACSQGTMNNFLFGNEQFGYYETICGGSGAGDGFNGASGVHTHMTNTRITDPEILEWRYPVLLNEFSIRKNSGGKGKWYGGEGIIRNITFTRPVTVTLLSQHRVEEPYGVDGGQNGKTGEQFKILKDRNREELTGKFTQFFDAGEGIEIQTPGGGGFLETIL